jgi:hypothetical protein
MFIGMLYAYPYMKATHAAYYMELSRGGDAWKPAAAHEN